MVDSTKLLSLLVLSGYFIAAFAAGIILSKSTKKFGTGSLEAGFKTISWGVFVIALGILVDALNSYLQISAGVISFIIISVKAVLFVVGTYTIVIGSKQTIDKLEALTR